MMFLGLIFTIVPLIAAAVYVTNMHRDKSLEGAAAHAKGDGEAQPMIGKAEPEPTRYQVVGQGKTATTTSLEPGQYGTTPEAETVPDNTAAYIQVLKQNSRDNEPKEPASTFTAPAVSEPVAEAESSSDPNWEFDEDDTI
jgi:hypothetical protein